MGRVNRVGSGWEATACAASSGRRCLEVEKGEHECRRGLRGVWARLWDKRALDVYLVYSYRIVK